MLSWFDVSCLTHLILLDDGSGRVNWPANSMPALTHLAVSNSALSASSWRICFPQLVLLVLVGPEPARERLADDFDADVKVVEVGELGELVDTWENMP